MNVNTNNIICEQNVINDESNNDSFTIIPFPWFPKQNRRKSRLGTHGKKRNLDHQNITPTKESYNKNTLSPSSLNFLNYIDGPTGFPIPAEPGVLDVVPSPVANSESSLLDLDFHFRISPLCTSSSNDLNPVNDTILPDWQRSHIYIDESQKENIPILRNYRRYSVNPCQLSCDNYGIERFQDEPSKSCFENPICMSTEKQSKPDSCSEKALTAPEEEAISQKENRSIASISEPIKPVPRIVSLDEQIFPKLFTIKGKSYTNDCILGKGGSSVIFQVTDTEEKSSKALKRVVLPSDESVAKGFLNEVDTLQKLQTCRGIIKIFDHELLYENNEKILYILMEKGESNLKDIMQNMVESEKLNAIIYYWNQMLFIVDEIHKFGVIHSDLKPANFVTVRSRLKLIDFGISAIMPEEYTSICKDACAGTYNYMSPEAMSFGPAGVKISTKSDVWSLGCILYSWIYGSPPFSKNYRSLLEKCYDIMSLDRKVDFPKKIGVPEGLMRTMESCLQKNPGLRPTVAELLANGRIDYIYPVTDS